jgi:anti-sigma regulatory factor (Ser/Thr protein kinase)
MVSSNKHDGSFSDKAFPPGSSWKFKGERLHTLADIRPKLQTLGADLRLWRFHYADIFCIRWAIGEALHNAIVHGHQEDPFKTVQLNYLISSDYVLAEVIDEGPGFDPNSVPNPFAKGQEGQAAKRGLFFMRMFMSWVRFDGGGNRVTLCKMRAPWNGETGFPDS